LELLGIAALDEEAVRIVPIGYACDRRWQAQAVWGGRGRTPGSRQQSRNIIEQMQLTLEGKANLAPVREFLRRVF
jgi:hypothetical protein